SSGARVKVRSFTLSRANAACVERPPGASEIMHIDLSGKTAIVTGSTAGIGLAIARGLAAAGAKVVVNGRTEATVEKAVAELAGTASSVRVEGFAGDLGSAAGCARLARACPRCDVLVN